jgi:hypothetical protein
VSKPVILLPLAQEDLFAIDLDIHAGNPDAAGRWLDAVRRSHVNGSGPTHEAASGAITDAPP